MSDYTMITYFQNLHGCFIKLSSPSPNEFRAAAVTYVTSKIVSSYWVYTMHDITLLVWAYDMDHTTTRRLMREAI
eukprot:scaffold48719_cov76-Attheya_sp.AAC.3